MIGNQVKVVLTDNSIVGGVLHKLDQSGAMIYRNDGLPDQNQTVFIPMYRISEIQSFGRPY